MKSILDDFGAIRARMVDISTDRHKAAGMAFAAPAIVHSENMMPVRALIDGFDNAVLSHLVRDQRSGLILRKSTSELRLDTEDRYAPLYDYRTPIATWMDLREQQIAETIAANKKLIDDVLQKDMWVCDYVGRAKAREIHHDNIRFRQSGVLL